MNDTVVWLIIAGFYAPLHFLGPIVVVTFTITEAALRRRYLRYVVIESAVSMALAFALAVRLSGDRILSAMLILLAFMLTPYLFLVLLKVLVRNNG